VSSMVSERMMRMMMEGRGRPGLLPYTTRFISMPVLLRRRGRRAHSSPKRLALLAMLCYVLRHFIARTNRSRVGVCEG
jgi:hypothetical protein